MPAERKYCARPTFAAETPTALQTASMCGTQQRPLQFARKAECIEGARLIGAGYAAIPPTAISPDGNTSSRPGRRRR